MAEWLSTKEVAQRLGVGGTSVKRWAKQGILQCHHTAGGHRRFSAEQIEIFVRKLGRASVDKRVLDDWISLLSSDGSVHLVYSRLLDMRASYSSWCDAVDAELAAVVQEIGVRWRAGDLTIWQEHIASAKLCRALGLCASSLPGSPAKICLLATAVGEVHTIGLSFFEVCVRELGFETRWLGERMPTSELVQAIASSDVDMVGMSASAFLSDAAVLDSEARRVLEACFQARAPLLLGGAGAWPDDLQGAHRVRSFSQLPATLERCFSAP